MLAQIDHVYILLGSIIPLTVFEYERHVIFKILWSYICTKKGKLWLERYIISYNRTNMHAKLLTYKIHSQSSDQQFLNPWECQHSLDSQ